METKFTMFCSMTVQYFSMFRMAVKKHDCWHCCSWDRSAIKCTITMGRLLRDSGVGCLVGGGYWPPTPEQTHPPSLCVREGRVFLLFSLSHLQLLFFFSFCLVVHSFFAFLLCLVSFYVFPLFCILSVCVFVFWGDWPPAAADQRQPNVAPSPNASVTKG